MKLNLDNKHHLRWNLYVSSSNQIDVAGIRKGSTFMKDNNNRGVSIDVTPDLIPSMQLCWRTGCVL